MNTRQTPQAAPSPEPPQQGVTFDIAGLVAGRPVLWTQAQGPANPVQDEAARALSPAAIEATRQRLQRFEPLLALLFEGLQASGGQIESPLLHVPALQAALGLPASQGSLWVKADHLLPVAGSVKARGGTHEVIEFAEALALQHGLIGPGGDYRSLASPEARALFGQYTVAVGSTGNLGLAIGTMAAALGFRAEVHMSADAKAWKKARLRSRGVSVIEHTGDYADAVAAGRAVAAADPRCHFVDDERSTSLFLGYATAAAHLAAQLAEAGRRVDARHPLFVYLPCGVGGAPGGVAYGLQQVFGPHVHCVFAEPTASPCFLVQRLAGWPGLPASGPHPSVYDIGLNNLTNPKGIVFMVAVLPQFIVASRPLLPQIGVLMLTTVAVDLVVMHGYAFTGARLASLLRSARAQRAQNRLFGGVLMAMGASLMWVRRAA